MTDQPAPMRRQLISSGTPFEARVGYSRAVRSGEFVFVAGTTAIQDGHVVATGDAAGQTRRILDIVGDALAQAGATMADIVRYRIYLTNIDDWQSVAPVLAETFGAIRPANTLLAVAALADPDMLVEIDADAIIGSGTQPTD